MFDASKIVKVFKNLRLECSQLMNMIWCVPHPTMCPTVNVIRQLDARLRVTDSLLPIGIQFHDWRRSGITRTSLLKQEVLDLVANEPTKNNQNISRVNSIPKHNTQNYKSNRVQNFETVFGTSETLIHNVLKS